MIEYLLWLVSVEALGLAALPLAMVLFRSFPDRGYGLSKPLGILVVGFVNWWLGSILGLGNYTGLLWLLAVLLAIGGILLLRSVPGGSSVGGVVLTTMLIEEGIFLVAFLAWTYVRSRNPDIYPSGGISSTEKPMDLMFLQVNSFAHSFPPPDAWLSGFTANYYYLGYNLFAMIGRMGSVDPRMGFSLANITICALICTGAYSLALSLTKSRWWAIGGTVCLALAGNGAGTVQVLNQLQSGGITLNGLNLFCSTRVIDGGCDGYHTFSEFPIFSLFWNDLHPHVMDLPFALLAIGVAIQAVLGAREQLPDFVQRYVRPAGAALILGAIYPINSWDYPTYLLLGLGGLVIAEIRRGTWSLATAWPIVAIFPVSLVLYAPYYITVHLSGQGIGILANPSASGDVLQVIGYFLIPCIMFVAWRTWTTLRDIDASDEARKQILKMGELPWSRRAFLIVIVFSTWYFLYTVFRLFFSTSQDVIYTPLRIFRLLPRGGGWWILGATTLILVVSPARMELLYIGMVVTAVYLIRARIRQGESQELVVYGLIMTGVLLLLASDFVYLRDIFDNGPNYRMNTVAKFYFQAWLVLSIAASYGVAAMTRALSVAPKPVLIAWIAALAAVGAGMLVYPVEGLSSQGTTRASTPGLDSFAYLQLLDSGDYAAIQWIRANTSPTSVIAEADGVDSTQPGCGEYWVCDVASQSYSRISALTGRPTVIGWHGSHESLWRGASTELTFQQRETDIRTLYTTTNVQQAETIIRKYRINYVYVSALERSTYVDHPGNPPEVLTKFNTFLQPHQLSPDTILYQVPKS